MSKKLYRIQGNLRAVDETDFESVIVEYDLVKETRSLYYLRQNGNGKVEKWDKPFANSVMFNSKYSVLYELKTRVESDIIRNNELLTMLSDDKIRLGALEKAIDKQIKIEKEGEKC